MTTEASRTLELDDIQNGVLHPRPFPYVATYILFRIDDRRTGRELLRRLIPDIVSAANPTSPDSDAWLSVAFTYQGLKAFGVPQDLLDSFTPEFQEGMAACAALLGDVGENSPALWEKPLGTPDVHVLLTALSSDASRRDDLLERARKAYPAMAGVEAIYRQDAYLFAHRAGSLRVQGWYQQPGGRGERHSRHQPPGAPPEGGRVRVGLPR